jgi:stearoyl-CoA desaturase (Delta-9 desaturase)
VTPKPRIDWTNTLFLTLTPLVAFVGVPLYLAAAGFAWGEWITFGVLWMAIAVSVTAGYHRLFAHRAYQASWPVKLFFLVFGAAALQNSILSWAADHRIHHSFVDTDDDPYNARRGFWWSHIGWIFFQRKARLDVVKDLAKDPLVQWQHRYYKWIGLGTAFGIPLIVGLATGRVVGALLIGGVLRIVVTHHVTFFINSLCHMIGRATYSLRHTARDSHIMAVLAFGEGYHNYHHTFAYDYRNGVKRWHIDPAKWTIWTLSLFGLTKGLRRATDAAILKARVEVDFQKAQMRAEKADMPVRASYEARLREAHERMQAAIQEALASRREMINRELRKFQRRQLRREFIEWRRTVKVSRRLTKAVA